MSDRLFETCYAELRRLAQRELERNVAATLSPTTLLHETFLNLSRRESLVFEKRGAFMVYAGRAMRGLIIDHVRNRAAQKRGGCFQMTALPPDGLDRPAEEMLSAQLDKLSEALEALAELDPRLAECVDLKFFCGYSFIEIAEFREVTERTVRRDWHKARLLLNRLLSNQAGVARAHDCL